MAAKLGFEAIQYVLKKVLTKKGVKGIATIPGKAYDMRMKQLVDEMAFKMKALGYDINKVTQKEVQGLLDSAEALAKQKKPKVISQGDPEFQGVTDKLLGKKDVPPFQGFTPKVVKTTKKDRPSIRLIKNFERDLTDMELAKEGYNLQEIGILKRARQVMKDEGQNPNDALAWVRSEMADAKGIEYEDFMTDFDWGDFPGKAEGGRVPLMYGGDPGFQFEYGGSWADWRDQHQHQMPVTDYIKTKMPKERLPFRDMEEGGIAQLSRPGYFLGGPAGAKKALKEILKKIKNLKKPEDYLMDAGDKLGKYYLKNPTKGADALSAIAAGTLISRHLNRKKNKPDEKASGGLAYMLGEPTYMKYSTGGGVGHAPWLKPSGQPQPQGQNETPTPHVAGTPNPLKAPRGLPSVAPKNMDPAFMQQKMMQQAMMGRGPGNTGQGPRTMANAGGRIGFGLGGIDKGRRAFMKWLAGITAGGIAAGTGLLKLGKAAKLAKPAAAVTETIVKSNAAGMPSWFPLLVKRVLKEGEDVGKAAGAMERQTVHRATLPSGTPVEVTSDLTKGDIIVDIGAGKHGWAAGHHGQPVRLELKKGEWIEPDVTKAGKVKGKGIKTKDEFWVEEAEFTGGHPENIKFEESTLETFGNHGSDFDEVEKFATGTIKKKTGKASIKAQRQHWTPEGDYAKGGLAYLLGE